MTYAYFEYSVNVCLSYKTPTFESIFSKKSNEHFWKPRQFRSLLLVNVVQKVINNTKFVDFYKDYKKPTKYFNYL